MRDNPTCDSLVIDGTAVEQVDSFKYLGTFVDKKLNFKVNTQAVGKKARKRIFIMKKLYSLDTSCTIRTECYLTFIQSVFIYHLCTIFGHVSKTCQSDLDSVISLASSMVHCNFPSISAVYEQCFKQRCLRMYTTDCTLLFKLEQLPSGRYRQLKCRTDAFSVAF